MKAVIAGLALLCAVNAAAAPNVTNATQKGSLLVFPDINLQGWQTLVRIQNDGSQDVNVKCYWMDGNKNRVDFTVPMTKNQPVWFDAATGHGTYQINPFPNSFANGLDNPFLLGPTQPPITVSTTGFGPIVALTSSFSLNAIATTTIPMDSFGAFQTGFEQGTVTFGVWPGAPNTSQTFTGTITRSVTIQGVTKTVSQDYTLILGDYNFTFNGLFIQQSQPTLFELPDGRQIVYTAFGSANVRFQPDTQGFGFDVFFELLNPEVSDNAGPYRAGLLACWAVDASGQNQVKWNHLSGTATVYRDGSEAYEYNAFAFFVPSGLDLQPVGAPGNLQLNGVEYDSCPVYLIGQFSPRPPSNDGVLVNQVFNGLNIAENRLAINGCTLDLRRDYVPVFTKLQFDVWNGDEVKFTGAYECADSWHETFFDDSIDAAKQNFDFATLGTSVARYRVQAFKTQQCPGSEVVGLLAVQSTRLFVGDGPSYQIGTNLAVAGRFPGAILWDPDGVVFEGGIR